MDIHTFGRREPQQKKTFSPDAPMANKPNTSDNSFKEQKNSLDAIFPRALVRWQVKFNAESRLLQMVHKLG
jgi:hypothetical protein